MADKLTDEMALLYLRDRPHVTRSFVTVNPGMQTMTAWVIGPDEFQAEATVTLDAEMGDLVEAFDIAYQEEVSRRDEAMSLRELLVRSGSYEP